METEPCGVNFIALLTKLVMICFILMVSPTRESGNVCGTFIDNSIFFLWADGANRVRVSSIDSLNEKGIFSVTILPASSLEKSRISLIMVNKLFAERSMVCK